jgi:hypothetical protein
LFSDERRRGGEEERRRGGEEERRKRGGRGREGATGGRKPGTDPPPPRSFSPFLLSLSALPARR